MDLSLLVNPTFSHTESAVICSGTSYTLGSQVLTTSGTYTETFQSVNGCDSIVHLSLTVNSSYSHTIFKTTCAGQAYVLGTQLLTTSGTYMETFQSIHGCDSTIHLNLTVHPSYNRKDTVEICEGGSYLFGTQLLTVSGLYSQTFSTINGCDSIVQLNLTVNPNYYDTLVTEICEGDTFYFGSQWLVRSGTYFDSYKTVKGCDSMQTMYLTVHPTYSINQEVTICYGGVYLLGTQVLSTSGIYRETFSTVNGCDSLITLRLRVNELDVSINRYGNELVANYEGNGNYQWYRYLNNTNIPIAGATKQRLIVAKNGIYSLKITEGLCSNRSENIAMRSVGNEELEEQVRFLLYPNPTTGKITIETNAFRMGEEVTYSIYNATGKQVIRNFFKSKEKQQLVVESLPKGVYVLYLQQGQITYHKKFIVQ